MTNLGHVNSSLTDGIATVTFGHPKGNSLPGSLLKAMAARSTRSARIRTPA